MTSCFYRYSLEWNSLVKDSNFPVSIGSSFVRGLSDGIRVNVLRFKNIQTHLETNKKHFEYRFSNFILGDIIYELSMWEIGYKLQESSSQIQIENYTTLKYYSKRA